MALVHETIDALPRRNDVHRIARHEELLITEPKPGPMKLWQEHSMLEVVHFPQEYAARPFAPPLGIYEAEHLRLEWQTMDNRQPFYHRNADVDELSYQIAGDRTLITELGVVEHVPGEFSRIPVGVAHDNYGRKESHLLFYVPAPVTEAQPELRTSEPAFPVFPGWEPAVINEMTSVCLGAVGHDVAIAPVDEQLLLERCREDKERLKVLATGSGPGTTWLYRSPDVWIGTTRCEDGADGSAWQRHLGGDEIQYQISGQRTLVSQRGTVELGPGDFVRVPLGVAFTSLVPAGGQASSHITVLSAEPVPLVAPAARTAAPSTPQLLEQLRGR
jgi:mannose-6-phosphate isomerase-like protein (cupin superfamily)